MILILLVFAFVLFLVAGWLPYSPTPPGAGVWNWRLMCTGLAFWVLTEFVHLLPH